MSYGGQSNAPWQRNVMQGQPQSGGFHLGPLMFKQNNMVAYGHGGGMQDAGGNAFPGSGGGNAVAYPQTRGNLNPVAFQQGGGGGSPAQYNSIGTVTKMSIDCGLVNDEIFFYRNVCKGPEPKLGDRVIFEATYSNSGQFKWNATRVQLMQQAQPLMSSNKGGYGSVAPPSDYQRGQMRRSSPKRSPVRGRHERDNRERERLHRSRERDELEDNDRKRRREDHDRGRDRPAPVGRGAAAARIDKERDRADSRKRERDVLDKEREERERERERERARDLDLYRVGPKGRRSRHVKRYMVEIPKSLLTIKTADVQDLHQRYNSLYIPSDFFFTNIKWSDAFTPDKPFSLRRPCQFHIMHEMVENPTEQKPDLLEPADANYMYSAKVMLMTLPPITEIYKKCFDNNNDDDRDNDKHAVHISRLINFLVGVKGRVGSMAIGGPWSPSLDGENPDKDPSVLIRTAIRTCKALTGIDLSNCTQWYRFVELFYHRTEYKNMGKDGPPRVETVVIYLPDVHSCMPSIEEWQTMTQMYKNAADEVINRRKALVAAATANENDGNEKSQDVEMTDNTTSNEGEEAVAVAEDDNEATNANTSTADTENNDESTEVVTIDDDDDVEEQENLDDSTASGANASDSATATNNDNGTDGAQTEERDEVAAEDENEEPAPEPTHYSLLELKAMKVQEIRDELLARGLSDKGVRNVVMARLAKALNTEKAEEMKKRKLNKPSATAQKSPAAKKSQEAAANKSNDEKMDVDTAGKKAATGKKPQDKKETATKTSNNKKVSVKGKKEKPDDWADAIDFELSDIVILDEYDSSKNEESQLKEMTEKEKSQLTRHYTLPSAPHIVVHPNRQAKGGKFDCAVVSLAVLLDYHPDDSKERFFEVSLFAELFNDMLTRDFGFNIYKEVYLHKEPEIEITEIKNDGETKGEKTESGEDHKKESKVEKDDDKEKAAKKDSKSTNGEKASGKEDVQSIKSESRKRKLSTSTSNDKDHDSSANDKKMVVVKPQLLLSFLFFDTNHCGYIIDKHLEDLFYVLGLNLSRSQIRTVLGKLGKFTTPHPIHYRKLTEKEATADSTPAIEDADDIPIEELERLAAGNNTYESVFGKNTAQLSTFEGDGENQNGLVNFNGAVVHVGKLLNQINRTEKNYSDLEKLHNDLLKQHTDLQKDHTKSTTKVKDLQAEIKSVTRKLTDANQDYYSLNRKYRDQNSTLSYIYTRVEPYFAREKDKDNKDKESKDKESKDKDNKDKDNKDKDNKDKEKSKNKEGEKEKEKTKEEKDKEVKKEKPKDEAEKEEVKNEKENSKQEKEKEENVTPKEENEKEKEEEMEVDKPKVEQKEKPKEEKEKPKDDKAKQEEKKVVKIVVNKDKQQPAKVTENNKEKVKEQQPAKIENNKPVKETNNSKPKPPAANTNQVKSTPQKAVNTAKAGTPALKKLNDNKTPAKIIKKSDNVAAKK